MFSRFLNENQLLSRVLISLLHLLNTAFFLVSTAMSYQYLSKLIFLPLLGLLFQIQFFFFTKNQPKNVLFYLFLTSVLYVINFYPFYNHLNFLLIAPFIFHLLCVTYLHFALGKSIVSLALQYVSLCLILLSLDFFWKGFLFIDRVLLQYEFVFVLFSVFSFTLVLGLALYRYSKLEISNLKTYRKWKQLQNSNSSLEQNVEKLQLEVDNFQKEKGAEKWISGLHTYFIDIIRDLQNKDEIYDILLRELALKMNLNQLSFYVTKSSKSSTAKLIKVASYAFDTSKHIEEEEIEAGETLLGQCLLEKQRIVIDDLPDGYLTISSGLGDASAQHLLIQPLLFHETLEGVIEVASFNRLETHQLRFIELISIEIASMIRGRKTDKVSDKLYTQISRKLEILKEENKDLKLELKELKEEQGKNVKA